MLLSHIRRGLWHAFRSECLFQCRDTKNGVGSAISPVTTTLNDLKKETLTECRAVKLEIFSMVVAIVENVLHFQPFGQFRVETEACFHIVVVVGRNGQWLEPVRTQGRGC